MTLSIIANKKNLDKLFEEVDDRIKNLLREQGDRDTLHFCLNKILGPTEDSLEEIEKYQYIITAIQLAEADPNLTLSELQKLVHLASTILTRNGFKRNSPTYVGLYGNLYFNLAKVQLSLGHVKEASWNIGLADHYSPKDDLQFAVEIVETRAECAYQSCHLTLASTLYQSLITSGHNQTTRVKMMALRCLRILKKYQEFDELYQSFEVESLPKEDKIELQFEQLLKKVAQEENPDLLVKAIRKNSPYSSWPWVNRIVFWLYASSQKKLIEYAPRVNTLRKRSYKTQVNYTDRQAIKFLYHLQDCYDKTIPMKERLNILKKVFSMIHSIPCPEYQLLGLAAMSRWAARHHQKQFSSAFQDEYRKFSNNVTSHLSSDALNILDTIGSTASMETYWAEKLSSFPAEAPMAEQPMTIDVDQIPSLEGDVNL